MCDSFDGMNTFEILNTIAAVPPSSKQINERGVLSVHTEVNKFLKMKFQPRVDVERPLSQQILKDGSRSIRLRTIRQLFFRSFSGSGMYLYSSFYSFHCFVFPLTLLATSTSRFVSVSFHIVPRAKFVFLLLLKPIFKTICRHSHRTKHATTTLASSRRKEG